MLLYSYSMHARLWLPLVGFVSVALAWAGCSAGGEVIEDDGDPTTTTTSSAGGGSTTGTGGNGGSGAGNTGLCGMDCSAIDTPTCYISVCNEGNYQGPIGTCVVVPDVDGTSCDDGLFCTVNDSCQAGVCTGGPQNDCGMTPPECNEVVCDEQAKSCSSQALPNGDSCTPGNLCETGGLCQNGLCVGTPKDCFFSPVPSECYNSVCNPANGMCEPQPGNDGQPCVDQMDLCSEGNTCSAGTCAGGTPKDCSGLTMGCFNGVCDALNGQCTQMPVPAGGNCAEATDDCNQGICDMQGMCNATPVNQGGNCDTDACYTGQTCNSGSCQGGTFLGCGTNGDGCCPAGCTIAQDNDCLTEITMAALNNAHNGNLNGINGADAMCQAEAAAANFTGTWKAFLSDTNQNVMDIVPVQYQNLPVKNTIGTTLWNNWSEVFTTNTWLPGSTAALRSFDGKIVDESTGANPDWFDADGWHGSTNAGVVDGTNHCSNWTSTSGQGANGELDLGGGPFFYQEFTSCSTTLAVMCVLVGP